MHRGNLAEPPVWQARPMLALLGVVVSIGLADSMNPSTLGPALYLASDRHAGRRLLGFIAGVFVVSATAGVVLVIGPGRALLAHRLSLHSEHVAEICAGAILVVIAVVLWLGRGHVARRIGRKERSDGALQRGSILAGAAIMAVELPTAVPYFAVIAAVTGSRQSLTTQVALILLFNLIFVAPLLAVLVVRELAGERGVEKLVRTRERLERLAHMLIPALVFLVGMILIAIGAVGLYRG